MTPYEKFKSLTEAKQYLKKGNTFEELDAMANEETDLEAARGVKKARKNIFQIITTVA